MLCTCSPCPNLQYPAIFSEISELELSPAPFCLSYIHILTGIPLSGNFLMGRSRKFFRLHALPHAEIHWKIHLRGIIPVPTVEIDLLDPLHTAGDIRILHKAELPVPAASRNVSSTMISPHHSPQTVFCCRHSSKFFSIRKFQNICPQDAVLALAAVIEHHSIMVVHTYDQYHIVPSLSVTSAFCLLFYHVFRNDTTIRSILLSCTAPAVPAKFLHFSFWKILTSVPRGAIIMRSKNIVMGL